MPRATQDQLEAIKMLLDAEIIKNTDKLIAAAKLGSEKPEIKYDEVQNLKDFPTPAMLIIPGKLHFQEKEFLEML